MKSYEVSTRTIEPQATVIAVPQIAELQVSATCIEYVHFVEGKEGPFMVENLKKLAFSEAAKANNADIIVSESIKVDYVENYKEFKAGWKIVINGYSAVYKKFRNATEADGWIKEYYENGGGVENGDSQKGGKFKLF